MSLDYSKGKIYKITSKNTNRVYIGSTAQTLKKRINDHRCKFNKFLKTKKIECTSSLIFEDGDIEYSLIIDYPCENVQQLRRKEGFYQLKIECVNVNIAGRTDKECYEQNKEIQKKKAREYVLKNYEKTKKYQDNYNIINKEKLKKKRAEKTILQCSCGGSYREDRIERHLIAKKHIFFLERGEQSEKVKKKSFDCDCGGKYKTRYEKQNCSAYSTHCATRRHLNYLNNL